MDSLGMQAMLAANMGTMPGGMMGTEGMFPGSMGMPGGMMGAEGMHTLPGMPPQMDLQTMYMAQMMQSLILQNQAAQQSMAAAANLPGMPPLQGFPGMNPYSQPPTDATITVSVEGMKFQYQLTEDDLQKVFSRYGTVKQIRVDEAGAAATVTFQSFHDAQSAMSDLNGKVLNGLEGTLRINWLSQPAHFPAPYPGIPSMPFPGWAGGGFPPAMPPAAPLSTGIADRGGFPSASFGGGGRDAIASGAPDKSPHTKGVRKYTCRFLIGIENDKDFQVARRIIGAKGANMKRVVKQTEAKLRLRGVGSGYYEGAGQKESSEPLQLCVSCTTPEGYKIAVAQVKELLKRVYEEYKQYCHENGQEVHDIDINLSENQLVYSSRFTMPGAADNDGDADDTNSPSKNGGSRRSRRSRNKRDGRPGEGDPDRGEPGPNAPNEQEIERFIDERNEARRANNFTEADRIRELLHKRGVALMDEPGGRGRGAEVTTWRYWRD